MGPVVRLEKLPYRINKEELQDFFAGCKLANGTESIHLILNNEGRASGLGYVELAGDDDLKAAIKMSQANIGKYNRSALVVQCQPKELDWYLNRQKANENKKYRVIMSGLPYRASEYEIASWFGKNCPCDVEIHLNRDGRPSGEATAFFDSEEYVDEAMKKHKEEMNGRYINLTKDSSGPLARNGFMVRMSGLPYRVTEEEIKGFFADVANCVGFRIIFNREGRASGEAYAEFETEAEAEAAMAKNKETIGSRYVVLSRSSGRSQGKNEEPSVGDFAIRMGGLPFKATVEEIKEWFQPEAVCVHAKIIMNRDGRPKGEAIAEFAKKEHAEKAMTKHKAYMGERFVTLNALY